MKIIRRFCSNASGNYYFVTTPIYYVNAGITSFSPLAYDVLIII